MQIKYNPEKNKTSLVQSPFMTLDQETRWPMHSSQPAVHM